MRDHSMPLPPTCYSFLFYNNASAYASLYNCRSYEALYITKCIYKPQPLQPSSHNLALPNLPTYRGVSNQTLCLRNLFGKSNAQNFAKIESTVRCAKLSLRKNYCFRQVSRKRKWGVQNCIIINMQNFVENPHMYCSICLWYSVYVLVLHTFFLWKDNIYAMHTYSQLWMICL